MCLETWIIGLLNDIQTASKKGENYDLHLESTMVDEIAHLYKQATWIEID